MKPAEFRIFLSSTFTDLQPEREYLVKKIFPQIRALCRERDLEFTEIDLRWGVTTEEARSGKTIRICLGEIDRCRPYFLGIIGSRYGWIPDHSVLDADATLSKDYPWLPSYIDEKKSITEMEFSHGVILHSNFDSACIYHQQTTRDPQNEEAILQLRSRLASAGITEVNFTSPEELGEHVLRDLSSLIERDYPLQKEETPAEHERKPHEAFAHNRTHSYIADPAYYERFETFAASTGTPLILWGKSGYGKSALVAYLTSEYRNRNPEVFIIRHFVGASSDASSSNDFIHHVMTEIKDRFGLEDEIPSENIQSEFPAWLAKIPEAEKTIICLDAVNQLSGIGPEMFWLPEFIPPNIQLIISTTPETPLDELRKRNWQELEMKPLSHEQRKRITQEFLAQYHKQLDRKHLEKIADESKLQSPLFLRTFLEELRIFGFYTEIESHIASYLASRDEAELFQKILARMEKDFGNTRTSSVLEAIWASHFGLSETELLGITGLTRLALSELLIALEFHLMRRSGLFIFFHNYLREAVEIRYLSSDEKKKKAHVRIADYFSKEEYTQRRQDEEPWQWQQAEEWDKYKTSLTDIGIISELLKEDHRPELLAHWLELQKHFDLDSTYHEAFSRYELRETDEARFAEISGKLGSALIAASRYKEAEIHIRKALEIRRRVFGENALETANSLDDLANLFYRTGNLNEAELLFKVIISKREKLLGENDILTAKTFGDFGTILYQQGRYEEAGAMYTKALDRYKTYYNTDKVEIADLLNNLGGVQRHTNQIYEAIQNFERAIQIHKRLYGEVCPSILSPLGNLALCYQEQKKIFEAEQKHLQALSISKKIYGEHHNDTAIRFANLGFFYSSIGRFDESIQIYFRAIKIFSDILGDYHNVTILFSLNLGITYARSGNISESKKIYEKYFPIEKELLGENHPTVCKHQEMYCSLIEIT